MVWISNCDRWNRMVHHAIRGPDFQASPGRVYVSSIPYISQRPHKKNRKCSTPQKCLNIGIPNMFPNLSQNKTNHQSCHIKYLFPPCPPCTWQSTSAPWLMSIRHKPTTPCNAAKCKALRPKRSRWPRDPSMAGYRSQVAMTKMGGWCQGSSDQLSTWKRQKNLMAMAIS